ncbi:hypothetical protein EYB26_001776 [Talaromyces marneffei]|uniref:Uncharacterized protein n=1 Tax=Talaromyces marneffei PM1 TaxID=1077442 RepID=A0A093VME5_TALMA|nr:uncharacterized protein EYB26_001776 [Talaromyces marneffei]QGA14123.1 hypothetical protein EYB26_001776 [Talaromyces marneffei]
MERDQRQKRDDFSSRILSRVGSVFRRASRRTKSTVSAHQIEEPSRPEATSTPASAAAGNITTPISTTIISTSIPDAPQPSQTSTAAGITAPTRDTTQVTLWSDIQQERARALFVKYGLTLEPQEWMSSRNYEVKRVEKPIRMRVRRTCHRCQTTFGSDKVCSNCQHVRCKTCPRYPPARTKEEKEARALAKAKGKQQERPSDRAAVVAPIEPSDDTEEIEYTPLTMESRTGGQDVIYKDIKQRVRRTCHQCQTLFLGASTVCESCGHIRCKRCPREPAKLDKYPDGYPGDAEPLPERPLRVWKKPRMRVRYFCIKCDTCYIPGENICATCGEEKGPNTRRDPPKKKEKPPIDEELLKRVQERLQEFRIAADT